MERGQIEKQLLGACLRLAGKGFLLTPADSFSARIPGTLEMILAAGLEKWQEMGSADVCTIALRAHDGVKGLHAAIYQERPDVGAIAISSPEGTRLLARCGGRLPPLFDEQARHLGPSTGPLANEGLTHRDMVRKIFRSGANAALLGERLLCLGMTCERVLFNAELFEKCAQAYVIATATGRRIRFIPRWVRLIANRRLLKDERRAAASYSLGQFPDGINSY